MLDLVTTTQFRKDLKKLRKRGADMQKLDDVLQMLCAERLLPALVHIAISSSQFIWVGFLFWRSALMYFLVTRSSQECIIFPSL